MRCWALPLTLLGLAAATVSVVTLKGVVDLGAPAIGTASVAGIIVCALATMSWLRGQSHAAAAALGGAPIGAGSMVRAAVASLGAGAALGAALALASVPSRGTLLSGGLGTLVVLAAWRMAERPQLREVALRSMAVVAAGITPAILALPAHVAAIAVALSVLALVAVDVTRTARSLPPPLGAVVVQPRGSSPASRRRPSAAMRFWTIVTSSRTPGERWAPRRLIKAKVS